METIRVGIIGAGWVVETRHLPALARIPGVSCRVIWSRDPAKARKLARKFDIPAVARSWEEVCDSTDIEAVVVATPPVLHCPATLRALEAGKHVLCQARMARNLSEAQRMVAAAKSSGRVTALYPPRPGLKGDRLMKRLLHEENFVGDVTELRVTGMSFEKPPAGYDWRLDPEVVGVNALTLGLWVEVVQRWVGTAALVSAVAKVHHPARRSATGASVTATVPDSVVAAGTLQCGAAFSYHLSQSASFSPGHRIEIYGSHGALIYRLFSEEILGATEGADEPAPMVVSAEEERSQTTDREFIDAIGDAARFRQLSKKGCATWSSAKPLLCPHTPARRSGSPWRNRRWTLGGNGWDEQTKPLLRSALTGMLSLLTKGHGLLDADQHISPPDGGSTR